MGRRKKKSLEEEFTEFVDLHKFSIISSALFTFEKDGIYDSFLFKDKYSSVEGEGKERARAIAQLLLDNSYKTKRGKEEFEIAYNYCWDKAKEYLSDDFNATKRMCKD